MKTAQFVVLTMAVSASGIAVRPAHSNDFQTFPSLLALIQKPSQGHAT
jgi:hypothetical protein